MKCPHCNKELKVDHVAFYNAETYRKTVTATTKCCYKLVNIAPITSFSVFKNTSGHLEDDWGNPAKSD